MREIIRVYRDDWYSSPDEFGKSVYRVKYKGRDGLLYVQSVSARDELDAAMHVMKQGAN